MGVDGLLPFVGTSLSYVHLGWWRGRCLAVDASCWLHRGSHACAQALGQGEATDKFLSFALKMVNMARQHGVELLFVIDGAELPAKALTNEVRSQHRSKELEKARELFALGRKADAQAAFGRAVRVTSAMTRRLISTLRRLRVPYIVAPYEADAQLAFLVRKGHCAAAITEDSDLLPYGCPATIFKLDPLGYGRLVTWQSLQEATSAAAPGAAPGTTARLFDGTWPGEWHDWAGGLFLDMCILAGTDYFAGPRRVGLKTAHALLREHRSLEGCLPHAIAKAPGAQSLTPVEMAEMVHTLGRLCEDVRSVFRHQSVYDPTSGRVVPLTPLSAAAAGEANGDLIGARMPPELAHMVCLLGTIDPQTLEDVELDAGPQMLPLHPPAPLPAAGSDVGNVHPASSTDFVGAADCAAGDARLTTGDALSAGTPSACRQPEATPAASAACPPYQPTISRFFAAAVPTTTSAPSPSAQPPNAPPPFGAHEQEREPSRSRSGSPVSADEAANAHGRRDDAVAHVPMSSTHLHASPPAYSLAPSTRPSLADHHQAATAADAAHIPRRRPPASPPPLPFGEGAGAPIPHIGWVDLHSPEPQKDRDGWSGGIGGGGSGLGCGKGVEEVALATASRYRLPLSQMPQTSTSFLDRFTSGSSLPRSAPPAQLQQRPLSRPIAPQPSAGSRPSAALQSTSRPRPMHASR